MHRSHYICLRCRRIVITEPNQAEELCKILRCRICGDELCDSCYLPGGFCTLHHPENNPDESENRHSDVLRKILAVVIIMLILIPWIRRL